MAGPRRRQQTRQLSRQSHWSFRSLTTVTWAFLCVVAFLVALRMFAGKSFSSKESHFSNPQDIPLDILYSIDAVFVLGGGAAKAYNSPPTYVQRRCDDAAQVVHRYNLLSARKKNRKNGLPVLCLSAGTAHVPQFIGPSGLPVWEATSSAAYLMERHNISNVFVETTSYDTVGNAYFARTSHTEHNSWRRLLVVTSKFHMARTKAIFNWIFGVDNRRGYQLHYLESPDVGLGADALTARMAKEQSSLESVKILAGSHRSLASVWQFMNNQHALYTADKLVERAKSLEGPAIPEDLRKSYGAA